MPSLAEADPSSSQIVPMDFREEVTRAAKTRRKGWLRLLSEEVRKRRFEWEGLKLVAKAQWDVKDYEGARQSWEAVREIHPNDVASNLALANIYERLFRDKKEAKWITYSDQAIQRVLGNAATTAPKERAEALSLKGRNEKTRWRLELEGVTSTNERRQRALTRALLQSYEAYYDAFLQDLNHFYPGLNALQMATLLIRRRSHRRRSSMRKRSARTSSRSTGGSRHTSTHSTSPGSGSSSPTSSSSSTRSTTSPRSWSVRQHTPRFGKSRRLGWGTRRVFRTSHFSGARSPDSPPPRGRQRARPLPEPAPTPSTVESWSLHSHEPREQTARPACKLILTECHDWIDSRRSPRGQQARDDGNRREHERDDDECRRVARLHAEEKPLQHPAGRERADEAERDTRGDEDDALLENPAHDATIGRTEREA